MSNKPTPVRIRPLWKKEPDIGWVKTDPIKLSVSGEIRRRAITAILEMLTKAADEKAYTPLLKDIASHADVGHTAARRYLVDLVEAGEIIKHGEKHKDCHFVITSTGDSTISRLTKEPKKPKKPSQHAEKLKFIKDTQRKISAQVLQIITDCAAKNQPMPTQSTIAKQLNIEPSNVPRALYALVRDCSISKKREYGCTAYMVTKTKMSTKNTNAPDPNPSEGRREPSAPARLKWLDKADALDKKLSRNDEAIAKRMKLRRDEMGLDVELEEVL